MAQQRPSFNKADTILINGKIVTVDANNSIVPAVAIKNGHIMVTGSNTAVKRLAGNGTEIIDLKGKTVLPGIIDSHTHPSNAAVRYLEIDCRAPEIKGIKDIQAAVAKRAKEIAKRYGVSGIPTFILFVNSIPVERISGAVGEGVLERVVEIRGGCMVMNFLTKLS